MAADPVRIALDPRAFTESERRLADFGGIQVSAFRYPSGVAALRVENGAGSVVLLPFQGQQVWDASFLGRRLTMGSMFEEPWPTRDYLRTYGAFLIHCGGTSMGNPGPADDHPLHGELPNLPYQTAEMEFGEDDRGRYVVMTGTGRDSVAFHHNFVARPRLRLTEGSTVFDLTVRVENRSRARLPFLYLAHINFRPVDGAELVDAVVDDRADIVVRPTDPGPDASPAVRAFHERVAADPGSHRHLSPGTPIEPELVLTMKVAADVDGWSHSLQRHPDGTADVVSHRPGDLPHAVRWVARCGDQEALGLLLPATAPPDGLAAARANGHIVMVEPGGHFTTDLRFGALDRAAADALTTRIAALRGP
jgi:hypothetical protein